MEGLHQSFETRVIIDLTARLVVIGNDFVLPAGDSMAAGLDGQRRPLLRATRDNKRATCLEMATRWRVER